MRNRPPLGILLLPLVLISSGSSTAQASKKTRRIFSRAVLEWQLPRQGFVEYSVDVQGSKISETPPKVRDNQTQTLSSRPRPAFGFYPHEMEKRRTLVYRRPDALDLMHILSLSLQGGTPRTGKKWKVTRTIQNCQKVGTVLVSGSVTTQDASDSTKVRETGELTLNGPGELPGVRLSDTTLKFERIVDAEAGHVASFSAEYSGKFGADDFHIAENWTLIAIRKARYKGFQRDVAKAIKTGCENLMSSLRKGRIGARPESDGVEQTRSYSAGRLALTILTLLKGNPHKKDPAILEALDELRSRNLIDSYSLGVALMALEAVYTPANERQNIIDGLIPGPMPRTTSAQDKRLMTGWAKQLMANRDTRLTKGYKLRFNYVSGPRYDNSVTQYAALGLYSAALCGVKVSPAVWTGLSQHYLDDITAVDKEDKGIGLRLPGYRDLKRKELGSRRTTASSKRVKPRGFVYENRQPTWARTEAPTAPGQKTTGSMTCAGISGMSICRAMLGRGRGNKQSQRLLSKNSRSSFAWLYSNYDVRNNPGRDRAHFYYYLYGLERACELSGVARIHDRDWYFEGAMQIIRNQKANSSWGSVEDSCFAILFLKKAVAPAVTGR
jgi:hypothetical protein